jgi:molybdate transport system ATP-binding protein
LSPAPSLTARLTAARGAFTLDVQLTVHGPGITALFGPSGSGKTSLLRCFAGLDKDARGEVRLGEEVWQDESGTFVPAHRRGAACVFQDGDLFPHLDVAGNLRFAQRRARGGGPALDEVAGWLGVAPLLARRTDRLSGGERQRVSLARAILSAPRLLLLDEPLSALDEPGRREILPYVESLPGRLGIPIVYVTHALEEAARLASQMIWLVDGRVRGAGSPTEMLGRMDFARWRGDAAAVVIQAVVRRHDEEYALTQLDGPWGDVWVRHLDRAVGETVPVQIEASDVFVELEREGPSSVLNRFTLDVLDVEESGAGQVLLRLGKGSGGPVLLARVTRMSSERLSLRPGSVVHAGVKSVAVVG